MNRYMQKTDTFFIIHNFNTVPEYLLEYCKDYMIFDASTDEKVRKQLIEKNLNHVSIENTGHNITTYFQYFADNYESLPEVMCLCKGNMIDRHCSKEFFDRVYENTYFTFLFEEKHMKNKEALISENKYLEENNDWYVQSPSHPRRYFDSYNQLLKFIYKNPILPKYTLFSPGACFIVRREQVLKHSKEFYLNLNKIMNYELNPNFPSEAHQVERMLPEIFCGNYEVNPWMNSEMEFEQKLPKEIRKVENNRALEGKRFKKIRRLFQWK
ncbi:MAG: DUF3431 domain-containing protein [Eubacteriales bacterium]